MPHARQRSLDFGAAGCAASYAIAAKDFRLEASPPPDATAIPTPCFLGLQPSSLATPGKTEEVEVDLPAGYGPLRVSLKGMRVVALGRGSRAEGRLLVGDRIVAADGRHVANQRDLAKVLAVARGGPICLTVVPKYGGEAGGRHAPGPEYDKLDPTLAGAEPTAIARRLRASEAPAEQNPRLVVLNCEDIGRRAAHSYFFQHLGVDFVWEGVERAVDFYQEHGYDVECVCRPATLERWPPPEELADVLQPCSEVDGIHEPERLLLPKLAQERNCTFVDNWNYREASPRMSERLDLKVEYVFDTFGEFVPLKQA